MFFHPLLLAGRLAELVCSAVRHDVFGHLFPRDAKVVKISQRVNIVSLQSVIALGNDSFVKKAQLFKV